MKKIVTVSTGLAVALAVAVLGTGYGALAVILNDGPDPEG